MADFYAKRGDTGPTWTATITDAYGAVVNLTGASVSFVMRPVLALAPTTNAAATIVSPSAGTVSYTPTAADTLNSGQYQVEWHITSSGGVKTTYPTDGYQEASIEEDIVTPGGSRMVSLGDVKDYLNIQTSDKSRDAKLLRFIDASTRVIEGICGPILQRMVQNETHDGWGDEFETYYQPIMAVHQVTEYRGPVAYPLTQIATPDLGTIYSYMWEPFGRITRRTVGGGVVAFPPGQDAVFITYTAGYAVPPPNVVEGLLELLRANFQDTQQGRPRAGGGGMDSDEPRGPMLGFYVPNRVRELLSDNKRAPSIA